MRACIMKTTFLVLLVSLCVVAPALASREFRSQAEWLDGSLSAEDSMAALERDTDGPVMMEVEESIAEGAGAQWRDGPRRHRHSHHSIRAEREAAYATKLADQRYAENLRKFRLRRQHSRAPSGEKIDSRVAFLTAAENVRHGALADADGAMTNEEARVESLLAVSSHATPVRLGHTNDVHAKLSMDTLLGRGLSNAANRAATQAGLQASVKTHPPMPSFAPLPGGHNAPAPRASAGVSLLQTAQQSRPAFAGPRTAELPPVEHAAPVAAAAAQQPELSREAAFVAGLPPAFMELDAATQLQVLALADADVDVDAEADAESEAHSEAEGEAETEADSESESESETDSESESEADSEADAEGESDAESEAEDSVAESELSSAATALNTLAALQRESHVPLAKLVHLLAKSRE